jgi:hypothetical protein
MRPHTVSARYTSAGIPDSTRFARFPALDLSDWEANTGLLMGGEVPHISWSTLCFMTRSYIGLLSVEIPGGTF